VNALDWICSVIGIAAFAVFLGVVAAFVPQPALVIVIAIGILMAAFDFWVRPFLVRRR
jgi:hypothetical protein